jgi:hypothetical protein
MGSHWMSPCPLAAETTTFYRSICELRVTGGHSFLFLLLNFNQPIILQHAGSVFWNYAQETRHEGIYGSICTQKSLLEYIFCRLKTLFTFTTEGKLSQLFMDSEQVGDVEKSRFPFGRNSVRNSIRLPAAPLRSFMVFVSLSKQVMTVLFKSLPTHILPTNNTALLNNIRIYQIILFIEMFLITAYSLM